MDAYGTVVPIAGGGYLRVEAASPHALRIRMRETNDFPESAFERYGIFRFLPAVKLTASRDGDVLTLGTGQAALTVDTESGMLALLDRSGAELTRHAAPSRFGRSRGFAAHFTLADGEKWYGLGDATRERLQHRGHSALMWVENITRYAPIPFLMSSRGWGLLVHTTWQHRIDIGETDPDRLTFAGANGELDYVLFVGDSLERLLDRYTEVAGRPALLPVWAYGLTYVCHEQVNARQMVDDALNFRREGIPCDMIGLEPGWMDKPNSLSPDKNWHPERFPLPLYSKKSDTFIGALDKLGFKLSLWMNCNYDLSVYEERRLADAGGEPGTAAANSAGTGSTETGSAKAGSTEACSAEACLAETKPFYDYVSKFVEQGVAAFKLTGTTQVTPQPGRQWGNGMDDEEMHNLYPLLLAKQLHQGFAGQTGRRPMIYSVAGFAGLQRFAATWAGSSEQEPALVSLLNHGMSGHVHTTTDMDVSTADGIHFGFLQPWSQLDSWAYWRHPCLLDHDLLHTFKAYARLRYSLLPYLYTAAHQAARTGMPIVRAMPLAFPRDPRSDERLRQYMLGGSLLTAAMTNRIYLPEGVWIDYWTGERYTGPQELDYAAAAPAAGPLFVKAGAIIPTWPEVSHIGLRQPERLGLHVYPDESGDYTLIEDDGTTYGYLRGEVAETAISCRATEKTVRIAIGRRTGQYAGMPAKRSFELVVHVQAKPLRVAVNGTALEERGCPPGQEPAGTAGWYFDRAGWLVRIVAEEPAEGETERTIEIVYDVTLRRKPAASGDRGHDGSGDGEAPERTGPAGPGAGAGQPGRVAIRPYGKPSPAAPRSADRRADETEVAPAALWEAELEIALETGDSAKAYKALEQWWVERMDRTADADEARVNLLVLYGLFVRICNRQAWAVQAVLGADYDAFRNMQALSLSDRAYSLMRGAVQHVLDYRRQAKKAGIHPLIRQVSDIVEQEPDGELTLAAMAGRLHVNSSHLSRLFKQEIGEPFTDYVLSRRMERAKAVLVAGSTVSEASLKLGYKDTSHFIRVFRKYWGVTPGELKP